MVASFLSSNVDKPNFVNSPPSIGCEDFYDEKAKQKKADLAESLGTDVGDKVARIVKNTIETQFLVPVWDMKLAMASGCGTGLPTCAAGWAGSTTRRHIAACFIPQSGTKATATDFLYFLSLELAPPPSAMS